MMGGYQSGRREHSAAGVPWCGKMSGGNLCALEWFGLHRYGLSLRLRCVPLFLQADSFSGRKAEQPALPAAEVISNQARDSTVRHLSYYPKVAD